MAGATQRLKVKLKGGGPWGFRLLGGAGTDLPLTVAKIRRKSKSYKNLQEGDLFIKVNGVPCDNLTYDQVMSIADKSGTELDLEVGRKASKSENVSTELKSSAPIANDLRSQTSSVANSIIKIQETKTVITDEKTAGANILKKDASNLVDDTATIKFPNCTITQNSVTAESINETETAKTDDSLVRKLSDTPEVTSDISTETNAEVTPTCEKYGKVQTEKIHEKLDNKETTIIRTDHEEFVKSHGKSPLLQEQHVAVSLASPQEQESETRSSVTRESYEITKCEKKEVKTTTKVNGVTSLFQDDALTKIEPSLCTPETKSITTSNTSSSITDSTTLRATELFSSRQTEFDSSLAKKKKMFSSSSFYEEPHAIYPTVEEQVEMAKKIAESLADETNKKSKGANMFYKRAKRSTKWIHEGPEPSGESGPGTPDAGLEPFYPEYYVDGSQSRKNETKLKLVLDPRHPIDAASLRSTGHNISEHNVVSPQICHGLARDLESPIGKGSALFAKRKKKSSEWVVDEEKVKSMMKAQEKNLEQLKQNSQNVVKANVPFRSPFDIVPKYRRYDSGVDPERLAETVIQAAECRRRESIQSNEEQRNESCRSPIVPATTGASYYDIYKAKAPKGWSSPSVTPTNFNVSGILETSDEPVYYPTASSTIPRKYQFQNFNTLPRKWKSPY